MWEFIDSEIVVKMRHSVLTTTSNPNDNNCYFQVKDDDGFISLYHGMEEDDEFRIDRQLTKTLNIFNQEVSAHMSLTKRFLVVEHVVSVP